MLYERILLTSKSGLQELFQASRIGIGSVLNSAVKQMALATSQRGDRKTEDGYIKCPCNHCELFHRVPRTWFRAGDCVSSMRNGNGIVQACCGDSLNYAAPFRQSTIQLLQFRAEFNGVDSKTLKSGSELVRGTGRLSQSSSDLLANRKEPKERNLCHGSSDRSRNTRHGFVELHRS